MRFFSLNRPSLVPAVPFRRVFWFFSTGTMLLEKGKQGDRRL
jgi:hypothetical protein